MAIIKSATAANTKGAAKTKASHCPKRVVKGTVLSISCLAITMSAIFITAQPAQAADSSIGEIDFATCPTGPRQEPGGRVTVINPGPFGLNGGILKSTQAIKVESDQKDTGIIWDLSQNDDVGFEELTLNYVGNPAGMNIGICFEADGRSVRVFRNLIQGSTTVGGYQKLRIIKSELSQLNDFSPGEILVRRVSVNNAGTSRDGVRTATLGDIRVRTGTGRFVSPHRIDLSLKKDPQSCFTIDSGSCSGIRPSQNLRARLQNLRNEIGR